MKIGILTFHNAYNYGAILQCYATQEMLKGMGHDVEVIDYHNHAIDKNYATNKYSYFRLPKRFWKWPSYFVTVFFYHKRLQSFDRFTSSFLKLSQKRYEYGRKHHFEGYDLILIGSDQLWNVDITRGFDDVYWGNFTKDENTKVLSWSISMNYVPDDIDSQNKIFQYLNNFDGISVREKKLQDILLSRYNKESVITLDPTLMLSVEKWNDLCSSIQKGIDYIAVYAVERSTFAITYEVARRLANKTKLEIKIIKSYCDSDFSRKSVQDASPDEFLSYIRNSKYVVTSSFHGTAFSIIFHKRFFALSDINGKQNDRINSLLFHTGLERCAINQNETFDNVPNIDFIGTDQKLHQLKIQTMKFLKQFDV